MLRRYGVAAPITGIEQDAAGPQAKTAARAWSAEDEAALQEETEE